MRQVLRDCDDPFGCGKQIRRPTGNRLRVCHQQATVVRAQRIAQRRIVPVVINYDANPGAVAMRGVFRRSQPLLQIWRKRSWCQRRRQKGDFRTVGGRLHSVRQFQAASRRSFHQSLTAEIIQGLAEGHPADANFACQVSFGWKPGL